MTFCGIYAILEDLHCTDIPQVQPVASLVQYSVIASFFGAPILKNVSTIICSLSNPNRSTTILRGIHLYNFLFFNFFLESYIGASLYTHAVPCLLPQRFSINLTINLLKIQTLEELADEEKTKREEDKKRQEKEKEEQELIQEREFQEKEEQRRVEAKRKDTNATIESREGLDTSSLSWR